MIILANILVGLVAILHLCFLVLEMVFWDKPLGMRIFRTNQDFASASKTLAMNQGLYNGFLSAGLCWSLFLEDNSYSVQVFFLVCVVIAGVFGALTVSRKIFLIQAVPAIFALLAVFVAYA